MKAILEEVRSKHENIQSALSQVNDKADLLESIVDNLAQIADTLTDICRAQKVVKTKPTKKKVTRVVKKKPVLV